MRKRVMACVLIVAVVLLSSTVAPFTAGAADSVCRIGLTGYDTLAAALAAVQDGQTIVLLTDVTHNESVQVLSSFTLDLAGYDLTVAATVDTYSLYASNGKQLTIDDSTRTDASQPVASVLNIGQSNPTYGVAVYASLGGSAIASTANVDVTIQSLHTGVCAASGASIDIAKGTIAAGSTGIIVNGSGSVYFDGNVTTTEPGEFAVQAAGVQGNPGCRIEVTGDVSGRTGGVSADSYCYVNVKGSVSGGGSFGVYCGRDSTVAVDGSVTGVALGVRAVAGTVTVTGDVRVTGTGEGCTGALAVDDGTTGLNGAVTIGGSVTGGQYGVKAQGGGSVTVEGNATSTAGSTLFTSAAVCANGLGSVVTVNGNANTTGIYSNGVEVRDGGTATVNGSVSAFGQACYGVVASSSADRTTAVIGGPMAATNYMQIGSGSMVPTTPPTPLSKLTDYQLPGYGLYTDNMYTDMTSDPVCTVYVKRAATPTASPPAGPVPSGTMVSLSTTTDGASIYYTTDGSEPAFDSAYYYGPIRITSAVTLKAIAIKSGMTDSEAMTAAYTIGDGQPQAAAPTASPIGGAVASGTAVSLSTTTAGASIHYTTDGSMPTVESTLYAGPISITSAVTIKAIATKVGMTDSAVMTAAYTIAAPIETPAATPTANPPSSAVASGTTVSLSTTTDGASIHYTTDGSTPSAASTLYAGPISITGAVTIKAIAVKAGMTDSGVMTETYTMVPGNTGAYVPVYHIITASAGTGGSISPSGRVVAEEYSSAKFLIKPGEGYLVADVLVDGVSVGKVSEYTFPSVSASHTIEARFVHDCPSQRYVDLDTSLWYHEGVDFVLSRGLFEGTSPDTFEPNTAMTRAMIATVLYRLEGEPATSAKSAFTDVPDGMWYTTAVAWGADEGVILGYGNGLFGPNDALTREQFVALFHRYAAHKGYDLSVGEDTNILSYNDAFGISEYAIPAMQWACGSGIVQGDDLGNLNPQAPVTRAEVAVMLLRFHDWSVRP